MKLPILRSSAELLALIDEIGIVPLFKSNAPGFSVEEMTPDELWFKEGVEGPWEWREEIANSGKAVYGKMLHRKAAFISPKCFPRFANSRRSGYDFDSRCDEGLVPEREKRLYELISGGISLTGEMKRKFGGKYFDITLLNLQMQTYVAIAGFTQRLDRYGAPYGWHLGVYATPESRFGTLCSDAYDEAPEESYAYLCDMLKKRVPGIDADALLTTR